MAEQPTGACGVNAHNAAAVGRKARPLMWGTALLAAGLFTLSAAVIFAAWPQPEWDPLGPYPTQTVNLTRSGRDGQPTINIDETTIVPVSGRKCVTGEGFEIRGTTSWQSVDPPGTIIRTGTGVRDAVDGCTRFHFETVIPATVLRAMRTQLNHGIDHPTWRIAGVETPARDGEEGVSRAWRTETFAVEAG